MQTVSPWLGWQPTWQNVERLPVLLGNSNVEGNEVASIVPPHVHWKPEDHRPHALTRGQHWPPAQYVT